MATMIGNGKGQLAAAYALKVLIPIDILWENVYRIDTSRRLETDDYILKITFFNDESVKLPFDWKTIGDEEVMIPRPPEDDFEAWKADAIMRCEAGGDFYDRPKPQAFSQVGALSASSMAQQGLNASYRQLLNTTQQQRTTQQLGQATASRKQGKSFLTGLLGGWGQ